MLVIQSKTYICSYFFFFYPFIRLKRTLPPGATSQAINSIISTSTGSYQLAKPNNAVAVIMLSVPTNGLISSAITESNMNSQTIASKTWSRLTY